MPIRLLDFAALLTQDGFHSQQFSAAGSNTAVPHIPEPICAGLRWVTLACALHCYTFANSSCMSLQLLHIISWETAAQRAQLQGDLYMTKHTHCKRTRTAMVLRCMAVAHGAAAVRCNLMSEAQMTNTCAPRMPCSLHMYVMGANLAKPSDKMVAGCGQQTWLQQPWQIHASLCFHILRRA